MTRYVRLLGTAIIVAVSLSVADPSRAATRIKPRAANRSTLSRQRPRLVVEKSNKKCGECSASQKVTAARQSGRTVVSNSIPCHDPDFVDPSVSRSLDAALRDMARIGIRPHITSAWRSSQDQARIHRCSLNSRCKRARGLYGALPAGQSAHEAGFAVDIAGIATRTRGGRRLTSTGRQIVRIMTRHGFTWRYGLSDPVHFEIDPRRHGYRSLRQAIVHNQTRCQVPRTTAARLAARRGPGRVTTRPASLRRVTASTAARSRHRNRS